MFIFLSWKGRSLLSWSLSVQVASHRLSSQTHYDFSMRTLKSVLVVSAQLRKAIPGELPATQEVSLVRIALLRCNLSKLRSQDVPVGPSVVICLIAAHLGEAGTQTNRRTRSSYDTFFPRCILLSDIPYARSLSAQVFMGVVDREFPEPGSAEHYLEDLKGRLAEASEKLNLLASRGRDSHVCHVMRGKGRIQREDGYVCLAMSACVTGDMALWDSQLSGVFEVISL